MSDPNQFDYGKDAAAFMRAYEPVMIRLYVEAMRECKSAFFNQFTPEDAHDFAVNSISNVIGAYETGITSLANISQRYRAVFELGATLDDMLSLFEIFTDKTLLAVQTRLTYRPDLSQFLIKKTEELLQFYNSTATQAYSEFQKTAS